MSASKPTPKIGKKRAKLKSENKTVGISKNVEKFGGVAEMAKFQSRKNYDGGNRPKLGGLRNGIFEREKAGDLGIEENQKKRSGNGQN